MTVKIYQPAKTAMQSGVGAHEWVLEQGSAATVTVDPLMGWSGSGNTGAQVKLSFPTKEEAIAYAQRMGLAYTVEEPNPRKQIRKSYSDNFKFGRLGTWTH
jgi:ETC complex I subunit conserved region